jgi:hypothetical protein
LNNYGGDNEFLDYNSPVDAAPLQPQAPAMPFPPSPRGAGLRSSLLKKPLDATTFGSPQGWNTPLPPTVPLS